MQALFDVPAPAKLNLFLHVVGRRNDGYHLLQSVFMLIDWADELHFERRSDGQLKRHDLGAALPDDDLCLRAAQALQTASGTPWGADISIHKHVPWGAGLGGGSSDAATTLLALNRLWDLHWPRERLLSLALGLGADVPFFVGGAGGAFVEGIGERLLPVALPPVRWAVVKPPPAIPTAAVFGSPQLRRDTEPVILLGFLAEIAAAGGDALHAASFGRNDLQPVAEALCPDVIEAAGWLRQRFGPARMSGSGSAVFARVDASALPLAMQPPDGPIDGLPVGWVGRVCHGLHRHPLAGWAD